MGDTTEVSGKVLGQISLMQSVVSQLPDYKSILKFVCQGCKDIPGVERVEFRLYDETSPHPKMQVDSDDDYHFSIIHKAHNYADLFFTLENRDAFSPYIPFLENFSNMLSIIFEEKKQRELNRTIMADLEKGVQERTRALEIEIEEHKQAEKARRENEAYLRTLIDTIPDLVWLKDKEGRYLFCNARFERFFGAKEKEIIGKTDYDFVEKDLADFFRKYDKIAMEKGGPSINEEEVTYADDGHKEFLETKKTPMFNSDGQLIGVLGIARDITGQKEFQARLQQAQKMEAIGTLAGGIAHDFNNILSPLIGFAEILKDDIPEDSHLRLPVTELFKASLRAKDLVRQILTFSRQGEQTIQPTKFQLVVKEILKLLKSSIPKTIDIKADINPEGCVVMADPTQLHQIVMNLATNAFHAMQESGGQLRITLNQIAIESEFPGFADFKTGEYAVLKITDTGKGIAKNDMDKIFDPYFTTKGLGKGTGLGLSVVMGIVKNYHGRIHIQSEPGIGTRVHVYLPALENGTDGARQEPLTSTVGGKEHILLVDDEPSIILMEKQMLTRLGYQVTSLTQSLDAVEIFKNNPDRFDLIISDMTMPNLTGLQLADRVKKIRADIPFIICTGFSEQINDETVKGYGIQGLLTKPASKNEFAKIIRDVLDPKGRYKKGGRV